MNFMAVTTVVLKFKTYYSDFVKIKIREIKIYLIKGDGEDRAPCNWGSNSSGLIKHNFPRHSATTFLVPD